MQVKMAGIQEFNVIVNGMLCPESETRKEAEKRYDLLAVNTKAEMLFQLFVDANTNVEARSLCMVLLRRLLANKWGEIWPKWSAANQQQFCEQLIRLITDEPDATMRKRLTDVIAEVAHGTIDTETSKQTWSGVLQFLEMCGTSDVADMRETAMILLENVPTVFGCDQDRYLSGIKQMFQSSLLFAAKSSVRTAAVRAYVAFMCECEGDDKVIRSLSDQVPAVIKVCQHVVATEDDDDVPLQCLGDLASSVPKLFQPHLHEVLTLCIATVADNSKNDSYRHSALEVIVSLCENAPGMMKKRAANFVPAIVEQCLNLMCNLCDDCDEWLTRDNEDEDDEEDSANVGESALDRIACKLGGKLVLPCLLQIASRLLQDEQNWKSRHAGIMALSASGEGCSRQMASILEDIVNNITKFLDDPHPRVRYAACNALGQMASDFAPKFQKKCHDKVVSGLCSTLADLTCPRVAAHAGAALVNFCEDCPKLVMGNYLYLIMEKLEYVLDQTFKQLLERGKKYVLEQVITTIASVADAAQDHFVNFYDRLMPPLKYILRNSNTEELTALRGKTIECISLIGLAVGKEKFGADADDVMQMLLINHEQLEQLLSEDDSQVSYLISAWARICKVLGEGFAPYLPTVMPIMLKAAATKPDVTLLEGCDEDNPRADLEWDFIPIGDQRMLGIKTTGLEEKASACEMLVCYAQEMKGAFSPYIEPVAALMLPLLKFMFHDSVRSAAAEIFPCLLECSRGLGDDARLQLWNAVLPAYKEAIYAEHERMVLADQFRSVAACIDNLGGLFINQGQLDIIVDIISHQMGEYLKRREERGKVKKRDDDEEEDIEAANEVLDEEGEVLSRVSDIIHNLFKIYGLGFIPYFDKLAQFFITLLSSRKHHSERQWMICIFDDLVEYGGETSFVYQQAFRDPYIAALSDEYPEVRQAAAYGFGIMSQCGGTVYAQLCAEALPHLAAMIANPQSRSSDEDTAATENAISAVAKILKYNSSSIDVDSVIPTFLSWLPIWEDADETPHVFGYLADLIESNNQVVLGPNNANLPRVLSIIVEAFEKGAFNGDGEIKVEIRNRLINIIKFMQTDSQLFQEVIRSAGLNDSQVTVLQKLLA